MTRHTLAFAALALLAPLAAQAQCSGTALTAEDIRTQFSGKLVCGVPGASYGGSSSDRWQEEHLPLGPATGGTYASVNLWDYKLGPGHAVDPRKRMGTWTIVPPPARNTPANIQHNYGGGAIYNWVVYVNAGTYSFCSVAGEQVRATVVSPAACGDANCGTGCGAAALPAAARGRAPAR